MLKIFFVVRCASDLRGFIAVAVIALLAVYRDLFAQWIDQCLEKTKFNKAPGLKKHTLQKKKEKK